MPEAPQFIGDYRIVSLIGSGGMGEVYLVEHPRLPRRDALKLLDTTVSRNAQFRARFTREADLLAPLRHTNIITVYDRGEHEGRLWLTMEHIDGQDAAALLRERGPLPLELVADIIARAGAALDYAYAEQQITHRDVKPANILIEFDRGGGLKTVKLADFGIAKAAGESTSLTSTGMTIGTMSYISPEAIDGRDLDNRADIYSLGCAAFDLLTGRPPYTATPISALMMRHLAAPVPRITEANPRLPAALDAVFARVLAKDPGDRYGTCREFADALRGAIGTPPSPRRAALHPSSGVKNSRRPQKATKPPSRPSASGPKAPARSTPAAGKSPATPQLEKTPNERGRSQQKRTRPRTPLLIAGAAVSVVLIGIIALVGAKLGGGDRSSGGQIVLPFTDLSDPRGVAVGADDAVYVAVGTGRRVLKLTAGDNSVTKLPFSWSEGVDSVAVGADGTVYGASAVQVFKVGPGESSVTELPFNGLRNVTGVAVGADGAVYVADSTNVLDSDGDKKSRVLRLGLGEDSATELPFPGLRFVDGVAIGADGAVYAGYFDRVFRLGPGDSSVTELPFAGLRSIHGVAVGADGAVYVADDAVLNSGEGQDSRVFRLPAGANRAVQLPFTGLSDTAGVAVDADGAVYVSDYGNDRVLKLPAQLVLQP